MRDVANRGWWIVGDGGGGWLLATRVGDRKLVPATESGLLQVGGGWWWSEMVVICGR